MRFRDTIAVFCLALTLFPLSARAQKLPSDVKPGSWAASAVNQALSNNLITLQNGKFNGDQKATHAQTLIAITQLARKLEAGKWKPAKSHAVPAKTTKLLVDGSWRNAPVTRYTLAVILTRFGDYVASGLPRPRPNDKDLGKSEAMPARPKITLAAGHPLHKTLVYLADRRMITSKSALLRADAKPIRGSELSLALSEMVTGLTNQLTDLGHDAEGGSIDINSKKKK